MSLAALLTRAAGTDAFGFTNYNQLKTNNDYLVVAGANLASAAAILPTNEFHIVTGAVTIDNINPVAAAVTGQQVRLLFQSALTIRNNGGGTGNIRTASGLSRSVSANEIVRFEYDGAVWREVAPGQVLAYQEFTAAVSVTATTEATANTVVTAPAVTFDGGTAVSIEFFAPEADPDNVVAGRRILFDLYDGATSIGIFGYGAFSQVAGVAVANSVRLSRRLTPSAAAHTYSVRAHVSAGTGTVGAGAGGAGVQVPGWIKLVKEV